MNRRWITGNPDLPVVPPRLTVTDAIQAMGPVPDRSARKPGAPARAVTVRRSSTAAVFAAEPFDLTGSQVRAALRWWRVDRNREWATFAVRYLNGDDLAALSAPRQPPHASTRLHATLRTRLSFAAEVAAERGPSKTDGVRTGMKAAHALAVLVHHRLNHETVLALTTAQHRQVSYPVLVAALAAGYRAAEISTALTYDEAATLAALRGFTVPALPLRRRRWWHPVRR